MSTITTIQPTDLQSNSRADINTNFSNLNSDKAELSGSTFTGPLVFSGTTNSGLKVNSLTTAQRDALTPAVGMIIYNTTLGEVQQYKGSAWASLGAFETGDLAWSTKTSKSGWLLCDGSAVSRITYSDLFTHLSTTYGTGDGSTTFNLPNVKGKVLVMRDSGDATFDVLGETGGAATHTLITAELPAHSHDLAGGAALDGTSGSFKYFTGLGANSTNNPANQAGYIENAGSGTAHNNLQPYMVQNLFIKF